VPCFIMRRHHAIVHAVRAAKDGSVKVGDHLLIGIPPGGWYIILSDGGHKIMSDVEFSDTYEPIDEVAAEYVRSGKGAVGE
jgi:hypothetical protein